LRNPYTISKKKPERRRMKKVVERHFRFEHREILWEYVDWNSLANDRNE
jgi:hypothetical protein